MEVIGKGGNGDYLCRFLPMTVLLFQIFVQLISIRLGGVHRHARLR